MSTMTELEYIDLENPSPLDVAPLYAVMVWPDNPEARRRWVAASILKAASAVPSADLSPEVRDQLAAQDRIFGGDDISDLAEQVPKRVLMGNIMGMLTLVPSVLARVAPKDASITALRERISRDLSRYDRENPPIHFMQVKTMQNREGPVQRFRPVAHFWAAHQLWRLQGEEAFPCADELLPAFIQSAEQVRLVAEAARPPRSPTTVMRVGEAVELPERLRQQLAALPTEVEFVVPPRLRPI